MALKIFNTLTKKVEDFVPMSASDVGMYTCGPTVYDYQHIGNFRTAIFSDVLYRTLTTSGLKVRTVRNITDIEDKIIKKSQESSITPGELTEKYTNIYFQDLEKINVLPVDVSPKATEHIKAMVKYIETLIEKGFAYLEEDGSVYFDISKFPDYGILSQLDKRELKTGTRILSDEYDKENVQDFALWKSVSTDEFGYDSPWGKGRPGWHIECSVMSQEYLGDTFDIHTGGVDLIFPHHENEIAQSEAKTGKKFVNFFVHGEHLLVDGKKMAKSAKNFYTLKDLEQKGFEPLAFRYLVLTAHYRDSLNFTWESLQSAQNALNNLRETINGWQSPTISERLKGKISEGTGGGGFLAMDREFNGPLNDSQEEFKSRILKTFYEALNTDLSTAQALAVMWQLVKENILPIEDKNEILLEMDKVLGLNLGDYMKPLEVPDEVVGLKNEREKARDDKDFQKADELRDKAHDLGFEFEDTTAGTIVTKLKD